MIYVTTSSYLYESVSDIKYAVLYAVLYAILYAVLYAIL